MKQVNTLVNEKKSILFFIALCAILLFFRIAFIDRAPFSWDQVINAWAAKDILIDHKILLLGMPAKLNSGFSIGPLYYYFVAFFYWIFHMDPLAVIAIETVTSVITFFALFFVSKKVFSLPVAFITVILYTFSFSIIMSDRYQWPVNFIPVFSVLILYFLFRIITGNPKSFLWLAIALGLSFHIHITSIFYPIIVVCALPFVKWDRRAIKYFLISIPLFLVWFAPQIIYEIQHSGSEVKSLFSYNQHYNHGLHLRRMFQIAPMVFLEFTTLLSNTLPSFFGFLFLPLFYVLYLWGKRSGEKVKLCYLFFIWVLIPWIIFSLYTGELTDYYFSVIRPIALLAVAYLLYRLFSVKHVIAKAIVVVLLIGFTYINTNLFITTGYQGLTFHRQQTVDAIKKNNIIQYTEGVPESYIYYIYTHGYGIK